MYLLTEDYVDLIVREQNGSFKTTGGAWVWAYLPTEELATFSVGDEITVVGEFAEDETDYDSPSVHKVLFHLALFCGLRRGELIALEWSDVDFKQSTISVNKSTVIVGKQVITKGPKNPTSVRVVSVPASVMQLLHEYRKEQQKLRLSLGKYWKGSNYIFIQSDGTQMYPSTPYETMKKVIHRYNQTAAEPLPDIPFHGLRHTSATLLIGTGTDVRTVSSRLGHAQTSTTMNIYAHSLAKLDRTAAENLDNLLSKKA